MDEETRKIVGRKRSITIRDHELEAKDFINTDEAIGFFVIRAQQHRVQELISLQAKKLKGMPPIKGYMRIEDGGEVVMGDFHSVYEAIGFLQVKLAENRKIDIISQLASIPSL